MTRLCRRTVAPVDIAATAGILTDLSLPVAVALVVLADACVHVGRWCRAGLEWFRFKLIPLSRLHHPLCLPASCDFLFPMLLPPLNLSPYSKMLRRRIYGLLASSLRSASTALACGVRQLLFAVSQ